MGSCGKAHCATKCLARAVPCCNSTETGVLSSRSLRFVFLVSSWLCRCVLHGRRKPPGLAAEIWHLEERQNKCCPESAVRNLEGKKDKQGLEVWGFSNSWSEDCAFPTVLGRWSWRRGVKLPSQTPRVFSRVLHVLQRIEVFHFRVLKAIRLVMFQESIMVSKILVLGGKKIENNQLCRRGTRW